MCTGAEIIPLVVAAVGTTATVINQRNVAHQQDQALAAQIRAQQAKQQQADARTAQLINKEATSTDTQDKAKSLAAYSTELAKKAPEATTALGAPSAASRAYAQQKSDAALGVADYGGQQADWLSSIQAPQLQRQRDIIQNIDPYKTDIGLISRANAGDNFLANLKLNNIRANPWLSLASGIAGGAANAMAKGGYGAGSTTADAASGDPYSQDYMAPNLRSNLPNPWYGYQIGST